MCLCGSRFEGYKMGTSFFWKFLSWGDRAGEWTGVQYIVEVEPSC